MATMISGNGSAPGWRKWQVYLALGALLLTLATQVFRAGTSEAIVDSRIAHLEEENKRILNEYARKDVIDQRLLNLEVGQQRIEDQEKAQADTLSKILMQMQRRSN